MLEAKAKDQEHRRKCSPKKNKKRASKFFFQAILKKKKGLQNFFLIKGFKKFFFRRFPIEENKKGLRKFSAVFGVFQQNFNGSKNSAVLEPRTGQFSRI